MNSKCSDCKNNKTCKSKLLVEWVDRQINVYANGLKKDGVSFTMRCKYYEKI